MRVPDVVPTCTAFLCVITEDGEVRFGGTAFYVGIRFDSAPTEGGSGFLVTARHNVVHALEQYDALYIRVNRTDATSSLIKLPPSWVYPESESSDVAVMFGNPFEPETAELNPVMNTMFATRDVVEELDLGIGDDIVVTGLFTQHAGRERNIPIVRTGIISAMPNEPLQDQRSGLDYYGYLTELRSFGGLSGSPVFVRRDPLRRYEGKAVKYRRYLLLGLIRGHWEYGGPVTFPADEARALNMGVGIVTPVDDLCDVLYGEEMMTLRREQERLWLAGSDAKGMLPERGTRT